MLHPREDVSRTNSLFRATKKVQIRVSIVVPFLSL
jgi:hypothetical protein